MGRIVGKRPHVPLFFLAKAGTNEASTCMRVTDRACDARAAHPRCLSCTRGHDVIVGAATCLLGHITRLQVCLTQGGVGNISCHDMNEAVDYQALAELRYPLRVFVSCSEQAACERGIEPHQRQLLLAITGLPTGSWPTVRVHAERLRLRHHSVVELIDRLECADLAARTPSPADGPESLVPSLRRLRDSCANCRSHIRQSCKPADRACSNHRKP